MVVGDGVTMKGTGDRLSLGAARPFDLQNSSGRR